MQFPVAVEHLLVGDHHHHSDDKAAGGGESSAANSPQQRQQTSIITKASQSNSRGSSNGSGRRGANDGSGSASACTGIILGGSPLIPHSDGTIRSGKNIVGGEHEEVGGGEGDHSSSFANTTTTGTSAATTPRRTIQLNDGSVIVVQHVDHTGRPVEHRDDHEGKRDDNDDEGIFSVERMIHWPFTTAE